MASTPYRRNFANMPIFADEGIYPHQQNNPDSRALQALQNYGSSAKNPTAEPAAFENLNLNSVEEEDEFLYGDSNSLPDEPVRHTNIQDETVASKPESGWSDEEDFYAGSVATNKEISSNNPYVWNAPTKEHSTKSPQKAAFPSGSCKGFSNPSVSGISSQRSVTVKGDFHVSVKNSNNVARHMSPPTRVEPKSKYHAAAEILKKKAMEKNKPSAVERSYSNSSEKCDKESSMPPVPGVDPPPKRTVLLPKSSKPLIDRTSLNIVNTHISREIKRPAAKHFFESEFDEANKPEVQKMPTAIHDLIRDPKFVESFKSASPLHHPDARESSQKQPFYHESGQYSRGSSRSPPKRYSRGQSRSPSYESRGSRKRSQSPNEYRHRSRSPYKSRDRSPYSHSRHRSPDSRGRSHDHNRYRDYSRSPPHKLRERSPRHYRSRSRSRSPKPYSSKSRAVEVTKEKLAKKVGNNSKTFSNIERGHSNSPVLIDSYSREKMKERNISLKSKTSEKSENVVKEKADKPLNTPVSKPTVSPSRNEQAILDELIDAQKNLSEEEKTFLALFSQIEPVNLLAELVKNSQSPSVEELPPAPTEPPLNESTFNVYGMPPEVPQMPYPQPFPFNPSIPPPPHLAPVSMPPPPLQMEAYPYQQMISQPPPAVYPPSVEVHTPPKKVPFRPTTLRSIPTSDEVTCPASSDLKKAPGLPQKDADPRSKSKKDPSSETGIESTNAGKSVKKVDVKSDQSLTAAQVRSLENQASVMESYKKLKAERHYAHTKVNKAVSDIIEMRQLIDETWSKKTVTSAEKLIYEKCKTVLASATETMNKNIKDAKHFDEELNRLKKKMTPEMLDEASNFKLQDCMKDQEPITNVNYILFDPGKHACYSCNKQYDKVHDMLNHLLNPDHQEKMDPSEKDWIEEFKTKPISEEGKLKSGVLHPIQGIEFMKPNTGYFCTLCKAYCLDVDEAERHLKGNDHTNKYKIYIKENPLYDSKCLVKRLIKYSMNSKQKAKKQNDKVESKSHKRKESTNSDNEKTKKVPKIEPHKEFKVEELEEEESISIEPKVHQVEGIKLTLSKEKEKTKQKEEKKPVTDSKAAQRLVFIGKAPNFKNLAKSKPWYKKEAFSDGKKNADGSLCEDMMEKLKEKLSMNKELAAQSPPPNQQRSSSRTSNSSDSLFGSGKSAKKSELGESGIQSKVENRKASSKPEVASYKNRSSNDSEPLSKVNEGKNDLKSKNHSKSMERATSKSDIKGGHTSPITVSKPVSNKDESSKTKNAGKDHEIKTDNPAVNQAIKNILYGPDPSSCPSVSLSEITLPEAPTSSLKSPPKSKKNEAVPMDISPEREEKYRPRTEEENEYFMLGISKDDMKPLAVPVPPPVINYFPETPTVPPMHIISSVPPPGYERKIPGGTFIPTSIPPPNYPNCPMPPQGVPPVLQGSTPFISTNVPPPGYNMNAGPASFASPVKPPLLPTPQRKNTNTNLIRIPTSAAKKDTKSPQAIPVLISPPQKPASEKRETSTRQPSKLDAPKQDNSPSAKKDAKCPQASVSQSPLENPATEKSKISTGKPSELNAPEKDNSPPAKKDLKSPKASPASKSPIQNPATENSKASTGQPSQSDAPKQASSPSESSGEKVLPEKSSISKSPQKDKGDSTGKKEIPTKVSSNEISELKSEDETKCSAVSDIKTGCGQDNQNIIGPKTLQETLECSPDKPTDVSNVKNTDRFKMETRPSDVSDVKQFKAGMETESVSSDNTLVPSSNLKIKPDAESKPLIKKDFQKKKEETPLSVDSSSPEEIISDNGRKESEADKNKDSATAVSIKNMSIKNTQVDPSNGHLSNNASKIENFEVEKVDKNHEEKHLELTSEVVGTDNLTSKPEQTMATDDSSAKESSFDEPQIISKESSTKADDGMDLEEKLSLMPSSPEDSSKTAKIINSSKSQETHDIVTMDVDIEEETSVERKQNESLLNLSEDKQSGREISINIDIRKGPESIKEKERNAKGQVVIDSQKQCTDTAESVFNYEAFEKLEALTQVSVEDGSESNFKRGSSEFLAPPVLLDENAENSEMPKIKEESCDQNQCLPPVLVLEVCKKQENVFETFDATKQLEGGSASVLTSHVLIDRKCSETFGVEEKEADVCSSLGTSVKTEPQEAVICSSLGTSVKAEPQKSETIQDSENVEEKIIVSPLEQHIDIESQESIEMKENTVSLMEPETDIESQELVEMAEHLFMELKTESEDTKEIIKEEESVNSPTEQTNDDAYGSDTETDEYENEDV